MDASGIISNEEVEGRGEGLGLDELSEPELDFSLGGSGAALFLEDFIFVKESFDPCDFSFELLILL